MKYRTISFLLLFFAFFITEMQARTVYTFHSNKLGRQFILAERINNHDYLPFKHIGQLLFPKSEYNKESGEIRKDSSIFRSVPASFYLLYKNGDVKIMQMTMPAITFENRTYVPLPEFFEAFNKFNLVNVTLKGKHIYCNFPEEKKKKDIDFIEKAVKLAEDKAEEANENEEIEDVKVEEKIEEVQEDIKVKEVEKKKYKFANLNFVEDDIKEEKLEIEIDESIPVEPSKSKSNASDIYIIPRNLKRNELNKIKEELKDSVKTKKHDDARLFMKSPLLNLSSSHDLLALNNFPKIIAIEAKKSKGKTVIHLISNQAIEEYHPPEMKDGFLVLRFPNAINDVKDYSHIDNVWPLKELELEFIRNFILYKFETRCDLDKISVNRVAPNEIAYTLEYSNEEVVSSAVSKVSFKAEVKKEENTPSESTKQNNTLNKKWKLDVIVIDPGHGGKDPGAISINGIKEKDLVLKLGLKLKTLINKELPGIKVVMTRDDDTFVELYRRGKIANENNGKLFISLHFNSMPRKPHKANGVESYILRPGRNDDAIRVANKENASIKFEKDQTKYKNMSDEDIIIATMAQSAFVKLSEKFAATLQKETSKSSGMTNRGVNQAGFYVLVGASMPNVLFEGGFLSNRGDEKIIKSKNGLDKIASGMLNAIKQYVEEYEHLVAGH